jgi:DNA-binding helix-hairpin-helix protein with protein kinase domain
MRVFQPRSGTIVYSADNQSLVLGEEVGKGGEGSVWSVESNPSVVAKFYHKGLTAEQARKVETMCRLKSDGLLRVSAWPLTTLRARSSDSSDGFLMPRIKGYQEAHLLYTPKSRRVSFPEAQFPFILHTSINIARAFATVHDAGQVIGDVNHGNLLIGNDATVALIDCDSFQISDAGAVFPCLVGVPTYTPPELQGLNFQSVTRSPHHDQFGLAVLLFHMLFLGRHPFAGIFRHGTADKTVEDAIHEFRFAYLPDNRQTEMEPPPIVPRLSEIPSDVAQLFVRAFGRDGASGLRPAAHEWLSPLESLSRNLKKCSANESHHYFNALSSCPWCRVENAFGLSMFGIKFAHLSGRAFDLVLVWAQIEAVRPDTGTLSAPLPGSYAGQCLPDPRPADMKRQRRIKRILSACSILLAVILVIPGMIPAFPSICILTCGLIAMAKLWRIGDQSARKVTDGHKEAVDKYNAGISEWNLSQEVPSAFQETKRRLQAEKQELTDLPSVQARRVAELNASRRQKQLTRFLERHRIEDAIIPKIGAGRKTLLRCYNIEDASDIVQYRLATVKGFGPALQTSLLMWRYSIEQKFVFNVNEGVDPADIRAMEQEIVQKRATLVKSLVAGPQQLRGTLFKWQTDRSRLLGDLESGAKDLAQAEANLKALGRF